jgi:hypothetical protein
MSAFKDALTKSLERVKKNNEITSVSFKKESRERERERVAGGEGTYASE